MTYQLTTWLVAQLLLKGNRKVRSDMFFYWVCRFIPCSNSNAELTMGTQGTTLHSHLKLAQEVKVALYGYLLYMRPDVIERLSCYKNIQQNVKDTYLFAETRVRMSRSCRFLLFLHHDYKVSLRFFMLRIYLFF